MRNCVALGILMGLAGLTPPVRAGSSLSGQLLGEVRSAAGVAQMGASVLLFNRYDQLVRQALSNPDGKFAFDSLPPDTYSIRVSLASFVPAIRRNIAILAGSENLLRINLASVLSTVEISPLSATSGTLMSDEWKWVLRTSQSTRPVLRMLPQQTASTSRTSLFSQTTGVVKLSAGDSEPFSGPLQQTLGTSFGVATAINGTTRVRMSGNLGYSPNSGLPSGVLRATYSHSVDGGDSPQVTFTARQIYLPALSIQGSTSANTPVLRTASLAAADKIDLTDALAVDYGVSAESVSFVQRVNFISTYARASYNAGSVGSFRIAVSSATQPSDLNPVSPGAASNDLNRDLASLSQLPHISMRNGQARVQRNQTYEVGYELVDGSRTYSFAAYQDDIRNATFLMSAPAGFVASSDVLADLDTRGSVFNAGDMRRTGYAGAVTQAVGDRVQLTVAGGRSGALVAEPREAESASGDDLRGVIRSAPRTWMTARASVSTPVTGTHVTASYGWTDFRALTPAHESLTGRVSQEIGWNAAVRQPLPGFGGMRMEALAEVRNLLAQGYLPLTSANGRAILTNAPRGLRGGLSFIF